MDFRHFSQDVAFGIGFVVRASGCGVWTCQLVVGFSMGHDWILVLTVDCVLYLDLGTLDWSAGIVDCVCDRSEVGKYFFTLRFGL